MSQQQQQQPQKSIEEQPTTAEEDPNSQPLPQSSPETEELDNKKPDIPQAIKDQITRPVINEKAPASPSQMFGNATLKPTTMYDLDYNDQSSDDDDESNDDVPSNRISRIGVKKSYSGPDIGKIIENEVKDLLTLAELDDPYGIEEKDKETPEYDPVDEILGIKSIKPSPKIIKYYEKMIKKYTNKVIKDQVIRSREQMDVLAEKLRICREQNWSEDEIKMMKMTLFTTSMGNNKTQKLIKPTIKYSGINSKTTLIELVKQYSHNLRMAEEPYKTERSWNYLSQFLEGEALLMYKHKFAIHKNRVPVLFAMLHANYERDIRLKEVTKDFFKIKQGKQETMDMYITRKYHAFQDMIRAIELHNALSDPHSRKNFPSKHSIVTTMINGVRNHKLADKIREKEIQINEHGDVQNLFIIMRNMDEHFRKLKLLGYGLNRSNNNNNNRRNNNNNSRGRNNNRGNYRGRGKRGGYRGNKRGRGRQYRNVNADNNNNWRNNERNNDNNDYNKNNNVQQQGNQQRNNNNN